MSELNTTGSGAAPAQPTPANDVAAAKGTAWLAYVWILWLVPLLAMKENPFAKFHSKQGIVLFLYWIAVAIIGGAIPILGWFIIAPVGSIILLIVAIMGIVKALGGEYWKAPLGIGALAEQWFKF